jgi:hypothetical protein
VRNLALWQKRSADATFSCASLVFRYTALCAHQFAFKDFSDAQARVGRRHDHDVPA